MDVPKVENVSAVFRNVLDMTHHMMFGPASEFKVFRHLNNANVRVLWFILILLHAVNPHVNVAISLFDWITSQLNAIFFPLLPFEFSALLTESFLVLSCSHLEGLAAMVWIMKNSLPTQAPVSPSYTHPWNGHWMHWLLTTLPPIPKCTPMWAQYACKAWGFLSLARKTTIFYPAMSTAFDSPALRSREWTATYHPLGYGGKGLPIFFFFWSYLGLMTNSAYRSLE